MNEETARRLALAQRIAPFYQRNPKVAVVLVAGSVGRGNADRFSDIELDIFWSAPPTEDERRAPIEAAGGAIAEVFPFEDDEWAEMFYLDAVKVDTSMFLVETMDRYLAEVVDGWSTDESRQFIIAAVQHSLPLQGEAQVERWREKAATFPEGLARKLIEERLQQPARWQYAPMLAEREDFVFLYNIVARVVHSMVGALIALNRMYLPHPHHKWIEQLASEMRLAPPNFATRLREVYRAEPTTGVRQLQSLLDETLALIERGMPEVDLGEARRWIDERRAGANL